MFIVYGWSDRIIRAQEFFGTCSNCQNTLLTIVGIQKTFNLFWIPFIPLKKKRVVVCIPCNSTFDDKDYPGGLSDKDISFRTPWWSFIGLVIAAIFCFTITKVSEHHDAQKKECIANPYAGMYFVFKSTDPATSEAPYFIGKVEKVMRGSVLLRHGFYGYSSSYDAFKTISSIKENESEALTQDMAELPLFVFRKLNIDSIR